MKFELDDGTEYTLSKFPCDTKLGGVFNMQEGCAAFQKNLDGLEKWADRNLMRFKKTKYKVLYVEINK